MAQPSMEQLFIPKNNTIDKDSLLLNVLSDSTKTAVWLDFKARTALFEKQIEQIDIVLENQQLSDTLPKHLLHFPIRKLQNEYSTPQFPVSNSDSLVLLLTKTAEAQTWSDFLNQYTYFKKYWEAQKLEQLEQILK